jgi:hypothetical protein
MLAGRWFTRIGTGNRGGRVLTTGAACHLRKAGTPQAAETYHPFLAGPFSLASFPPSPLPLEGPLQPPKLKIIHRLVLQRRLLCTSQIERRPTTSIGIQFSVAAYLTDITGRPTKW